MLHNKLFESFGDDTWDMVVYQLKFCVWLYKRYDMKVGILVNTNAKISCRF